MAGNPDIYLRPAGFLITVTIQGTAAVTIPLTMGATAALPIQAPAGVVIPLTVASTAQLTIHAVEGITIPLTVSATATAPIHAAVGVAIPLAVSASGALSINAAVSVVLPLTMGSEGAVSGGVVPVAAGGGRGRRVGVRHGRGVRLREWELRQQWKREAEEERQRALKPRRRPKPVEAGMPAFGTDADILPSDQPWSPDDQTDADDLLMILALIET